MKYPLKFIFILASFEGKCLYGRFNDILLVLNFNFPFYDNIPLLKDLYEGVFARVVTCGPPSSGFGEKRQPDIIFNEKYGHFGYHCMALAMERYKNYKGYLFANDDMIINWWTMINRDKEKIWHGTKVVDWRQQAYGNIVAKDWIWWETHMGINACQNYFSQLKLQASNGTFKSIALKSLNVYLLNSYGSPRCGKGWADFFYVPRIFAEPFICLSTIAYSSKLFLEIAVHNILRSLDLIDNFEVLDGLYLPDEGKFDFKVDEFWKSYSHQVAFVHPFKFQGRNKHQSLAILKQRVLRFKDKLTKC